MGRSDRKKQIRALAEKTGKRPRGSANILNREAHLRAAPPSPPRGFFEVISDAIRQAHPDVGFDFEDAWKRLTVKLGTTTMVFVTPYNREPKWPVTGWNETLPRNDWESKRGWQCENIDDILTVLRWPDANPSGPYTDVNELRDDFENPSKHVWVRVGGNALDKAFECKACKKRIYVHPQETPEEVARMGYKSWREREAGTFPRGGGITRAMEVGFIPPRCPGEPKDAVNTATETLRTLTQNPIREATEAMRALTQNPIREAVKPFEALRANTLKSAAEMLGTHSLKSSAELLGPRSLKSSIQTSIEALSTSGLKDAISGQSIKDMTSAGNLKEALTGLRPKRDPDPEDGE